VAVLAMCCLLSCGGETSAPSARVDASIDGSVPDAAIRGTLEAGRDDGAAFETCKLHYAPRDPRCYVGYVEVPRCTCYGGSTGDTWCYVKVVGGIPAPPTRQDTRAGRT
jgi:hypothetical protein